MKIWHGGSLNCAVVLPFLVRGTLGLVGRQQQRKEPSNHCPSSRQSCWQSRPSWHQARVLRWPWWLVRSSFDWAGQASPPTIVAAIYATRHRPNRTVCSWLLTLALVHLHGSWGRPTWPWTRFWSCAWLRVLRVCHDARANYHKRTLDSWTTSPRVLLWRTYQLRQ